MKPYVIYSHFLNRIFLTNIVFNVPWCHWSRHLVFCSILITFGLVMKLFIQELIIFISGFLLLSLIYGLTCCFVCLFLLFLFAFALYRLFLLILLSFWITSIIFTHLFYVFWTLHLLFSFFITIAVSLFFSSSPSASSRFCSAKPDLWLFEWLLHRIIVILVF